VEREDLPTVASRHLVAEGPALDDGARLRRPITLAHDVLAGMQVALHQRDRVQGSPLLGREVDNALQLADEGMWVGCVRMVHDGFPRKREQVHSQLPAPTVWMPAILLLYTFIDLCR
jgi:hypothetical protein